MLQTIVVVVRAEKRARSTRHGDETATDRATRHLRMLHRLHQHALVVVEDHWGVCCGEVCVASASCAYILTGFAGDALPAHILYAAILAKLQHSCWVLLWLALVRDRGQRLYATCEGRLGVPAKRATIESAQHV